MDEPRAMREIHKIRERLWRKWKKLSDKEILEDIRKRALLARKEMETLVKA